MQWISTGKDTAKQREDLGNWKIQSLLVCVGVWGPGSFKASEELSSHSWELFSLKTDWMFNWLATVVSHVLIQS